MSSEINILTQIESGDSTTIFWTGPSMISFRLSMHVLGLLHQLGLINIMMKCDMCLFHISVLLIKTIWRNGTRNLTCTNT